MEQPHSELVDKWRVIAEEIAAAVVVDGSLEAVQLVGGVDISFVKGDDFTACAALIVTDFPSCSRVLYEELRMVRLTQPYVPGFLAFREADFLVELLETLRQKQPQLFPDVVLVDGQGIFHPQACGLACHIGVRCRVPTIGIGKTFLQVDGLDFSRIKEDFLLKCQTPKSYLLLTGNSGRVWGAAVATVSNLRKPIFVSVGNGLTLERALEIVFAVAKFRQPEPIRLADHKSRQFLSGDK